MSDVAKASDVRLTPDWFLEYVRAFAGGPIALDVCTEPSNPTKADAYCCLEDGNDGLLIDWSLTLRSVAYVPGWAMRLAWANVPYSAGQVIKWAGKAAHEARRDVESLLLTKDDCRPRWNRFLLDNADARCRIARGVGFLEPDGNGGFRQLVGPRWGSCLWYFGRHRRRFERVFGPLGEITHLLGPQESP
jgi:hypothetical protein